MRLEEFPKFTLAHSPTPLEPLRRLQEHLGRPRLYIKRDDCTGLALGGNKTRKLEFLIGDALAAGATTIVTEGGLQSNHVRQTAAAAARAGLKCHLVLDHGVPIHTPIYVLGGNVFLDRLLGAVTHFCAAGETRASRIEALTAELRARGEVVCNIPTGGSTAVGALGYAAVMVELLQQAKSLQLSIDHVVVASSSGGTQAGLVVGKALAKAAPSIIGIDVDGKPEYLMAAVQSIATDCAGKLGVEHRIAAEAIEIVQGYAAPGYGLPNEKMIETVKLLARLEGILLDPVYTGKAMAGFIDMTRSRRFGKGETAVFIHTGGTPGLFAYADIF
jgi:L-cysteate sulfo-lyase